jgi:hypothetical protein
MDTIAQRLEQGRSLLRRRRRRIEGSEGK